MFLIELTGTFILNVLHSWKWLGQNPEPFYNPSSLVISTQNTSHMVQGQLQTTHTPTQNYNADKHLTAEGQPPTKTSSILRIIQKTGNIKQT
jgi:hypothetical protein